MYYEDYHTASVEDASADAYSFGREMEYDRPDPGEYEDDFKPSPRDGAPMPEWLSDLFDFGQDNPDEHPF